MPKKKSANGSGSIYFDAARKIWRGAICIGYDQEGKQRRKTVSGKSKTEVVKKLKQIEFGIYSGTFTDKSSITIYQLAKQIIEDKHNFNEINENTYYTHLCTLNRLKPIYNTPLQAANETQIRAFLQTELDKSNSILHKDVELLRSTFREAVKREIIIKSPMENIKTPRSRQKQEKVRALTVDEQSNLLRVLLSEDIKYSQQMILSILTGMRMGEINALTKSDVNLTFGTVTINKTISRGEKGAAIIGQSPKTAAGNRTIYLSADAKKIFADCLQWAENRLFLTESGKLITTNQVNMELQRTLQKHKILDESIPGKVSCHSLRHTYATRMIESGMQPKVLQQLLGHTDIRITMNTYCDAFQRLQDDNINAAEEYLRKSGLSLEDLSSPTEEQKSG